MSAPWMSGMGLVGGAYVGGGRKRKHLPSASCKPCKGRGSAKQKAAAARNPWINFLRGHAGSGMSRAELSHAYRLQR